MPTSMKRATLFAYQALGGPPATSADWAAQYITYPTIDPVSTQEIAKYERDSRAMESALRPGTLYYKVSLAVEVDSREFARLLVAGAGYAYSGGAHHLTWGDDPASWLTMWRYDGITGEMRKVSNLVLNTLSMPMDFTAGKLTATLEFFGLGQDPEDLGGISYATYADSRNAFTARQSVLRRAGAGFCPITATLKLDNHVGPLYCGPSVDPVAGDPAYLVPDELQPGDITGTLDLTARYDGNADSLVEDSVLAREAAYTLTQTDPESTPAKVALWTFPRLVPSAPGSVQSNVSERQQRQAVNFALLTGTDELIATLDVTNGEGALI